MPETRDVKKLLEEARTAHRAKQWPDAERLWRQYVIAAPAQPTGHINLGLALFALGRIDEAAACAEVVRTRWPERVEGAVLGARTAAHGADVNARLTAWRPVAGAFPDSAAACNEYGRALLESGALTEANTLADRLAVLDRKLGLHLKGRVLDTAQPEADHTDFWRDAAQAFPDDIDFRRKALQAALWAGRVADARAQFETLLAAGRGRLADVNFVIGLANLHRAAGDRATLRAIVRAYFGAMAASDDYRLAALKLSRVVFSDFPHSAVAPASVAPRFAAMVRNAPLSGGARRWLHDATALYDRVVKAAPASLLETDVSAAQCQDFVDTVHKQVAAGAPFSLVRLGDGESNALGYEPHLQSFLESDAADRERIWWGAALDAGARADLNTEVRTAIWGADMLGIPCAGRAVRDLDLKSDGPALEAGRSGRGLRGVLHAVHARLDAKEALPIFVSSHLHQDLYKHGLYGKLLGGLRDIVCVSSYAALPEVLASRFGAASATNITLRPEHSPTSRAELAHAIGVARRDSGREGWVLPEQIEDVIAALPADLHGRLVIIAAGFAGKRIGEEAKRRGGVALDLGSIADYWMGVRTRGYLDLV